MSNILILLTVLAILKSVISLSLSPGWWNVLCVGILCGGWIIAEHDYLLSWSKQWVDEQITEYSTLMNLSLAIMFDLLLTVGQCWVSMQKWFGKKMTFRENWMQFNLCLSLFPALTYLHVCLFFALPGADFLWETWGLTLGILLFLCGGTWLFRKLIPEMEFRLELTGILAFLLFLAVVSCAVFHPAVQTGEGEQSVDWRQMSGVMFTLFTCVCVGFLIQYFRYCKKKKCKF